MIEVIHKASKENLLALTQIENKILDLIKAAYLKKSLDKEIYQKFVEMNAMKSKDTYKNANEIQEMLKGFFESNDLLKKDVEGYNEIIFSKDSAIGGLLSIDLNTLKSYPLN